MKIGNAKDLRRLDESVITDYGVHQSVLMENAAIAARDVIQLRWGIAGGNILVVCGVGNNGGDGFALARQLYARGAGVTIIMAGDPSRLTGGSADNFDTVRRLPLEILNLEASPHPKLLERHNFNQYNLIVDALFGTGLSRNLEGPLAALVDGINDSNAPVLALDIPSGVSADTGEVLGRAVQAEATVSFGVLKRGNLLYPGYRLGGVLYHSGISFPPEVTQDDALNIIVNLPPDPPKRDPHGHKGTFGKILVIGGSAEYSGAPAFAAAAVLKGGAGYVYLAVPENLVARIFSLVPEAVFLPQAGRNNLGGEHAPDLLKQAEKADAVVLGPGLSTHSESIRLARDILAGLSVPLVVDGDALTALAGREELIRDKKTPVILTPHPGEMARLLGSSVQEIETRRIETAQEAAERYGAVVVLKGAHSIITEPAGRTWINLTGNSGMGTAGSGDVLAGLTGALAARWTTEIADAARLAVHLHGLAGDLAADKRGEVSMTGKDVLKHLPAAFQEYRKRLNDDPFSGKIIPI